MIDRYKFWQRESVAIVVRQVGLGHLPPRDQLQLLRQLVAQRRAEALRQLEATK